MKEGCQTSWILQDETLASEYSVLQDEKNDPKASQRSSSSGLPPHFQEGASSQFQQAIVSALTCGDGAAWNLGDLTPTCQNLGDMTSHLAELWAEDHCLSVSRKQDHCSSRSRKQSIEPKRIILEP